MENYTISFKNGHKMKIQVIDGKKFIKSLIKGPQGHPGAKQHIYIEEHVLINLTDITACHPSGMDAVEPLAKEDIA